VALLLLVEQRFRRSISLSSPPIASICAFSSGDSSRSRRFSSQSSGMSNASDGSADTPWKYAPNAWSNLSKYCSSFTSVMRARK
jgi:hypothetical protein